MLMLPANPGVLRLIAVAAEWSNRLGDHLSWQVIVQAVEQGSSIDGVVIQSF